MPKGGHKVDLVEEIGILFNDCQKTFAAHKRSLSSMKLLYENNKEEFIKVIISNVNHLLVVFKRDPCVERLIQLMISFAKENTEFGLAFLRYLLEHSQAKDKAVRFRVCQFVAGIIGGFTDDVELDDELWARITKLMLIRAKDKVPTVRIHAVSALRRFQDPSNQQDPVIAEYIRLMQTDSCKDVRKAAALNVGIFKTTIGPLLKRTRDSKEDVRKAAFSVISEKVKLTQLSIAQRLSLVREGLKDRCEAVKSVCVGMITKQWFECVNSDPIQLLKLLDVESTEEAGESVIKTLLAVHPNLTPRFPADEAAMISFEAESALFLRVFCQLAKEQKSEQKLDEVLPEIIKYCELLRAYIKFDDLNEFVLKQMLNVAQFLDLADEAGRRSLADLQRELLTSALISEELISAPVKILRTIYPNESEFLMIVLEMLAETKEPLEMAESEEGKALMRAHNEQLIALQEKIKTLEVQKKAAIKRDRLEEASELKKQIELLTTEHAQLKEAVQLRDEMRENAWQRCLSITEQLLLLPTRSGINSGGIAGLKDSVILPCIQCPVTARRKRAMLCMGLYCLLSETEARKMLPILVSAIESDADEVKEVALRGLADVIMMFGFEALVAKPTATPEVEPARDEVLHKRLVSILAEHLDHELESVRTVAVESVAKLMVLDELRSAPLFAHLAVLFFNPMTEDDALLRQCLSVFFAAYVFSSPEHTTVVEDSFAMVLETIINAPPRSPLKKIQLVNVVQFLISITDPVNALLGQPPRDDGVAAKPKPNTATHERLGVVLAQQVLADSASSSDAKALCKCLGYLQPTGADLHAIKCLRVLTKQIQEHLADTDKTSAKVVEKLAERLKALDATPDEPLSAEQQQKLDAATQQRQAATKKPAKAPAAAKGKPRGKASVSKKKYESEDELSEDEESDEAEASDSDESEEEAVVRKPTASMAASRAPPARATTKVTPKTVLQSESEEDEGEEEEAPKKATNTVPAPPQPKTIAAVDKQGPNSERVERADVRPAVAPAPFKSVAPVAASMAFAAEQDSISSLHESEDEDEAEPAKKKAASVAAVPGKASAAPIAKGSAKPASALVAKPTYTTVNLALNDSDDEKPAAKHAAGPPKHTVSDSDEESEQLSPPTLAAKPAVTGAKSSAGPAPKTYGPTAAKKPTVSAPILATSVRSLSKPKATAEAAPATKQPVVAKASARPITTALAEPNKIRPTAIAKPASTIVAKKAEVPRKPPVPTAASKTAKTPSSRSGLSLTTPNTKIAEAQRMNDEMSRLLNDTEANVDYSDSAESDEPKENIRQRAVPAGGAKTAQTARVLSEIEDMLSD